MLEIMPLERLYIGKAVVHEGYSSNNVWLVEMQCMDGLSSSSVFSFCVSLKRK